MMAIRLLIVDDSPQVRKDLGTLLTLAGDIDIVGEAANGQQGYRLAEELWPDVVLMDLEMPVLDGLEAVRRIKATDSACRVIMLTVQGSAEDRRRANLAGADAFIVKGAPFEILLKAIRGGFSDKSKLKGGLP